jgi:hypothetical protein
VAVGFTEAVRAAGLATDTERRRAATRALVESLVLAALVLAAYFVVPLGWSGAPLLGLVLGMLLVAVLLGRSIVETARSPYPRVRAARTLLTTLPLLMCVFAATYVVLSDAEPGSFSESLTRLDALYFTVTVFATVGFGDITAVSQTARTIVMVQMVGGVVVVGLVVRVLLRAVQTGLERHGR